MEKLYATKSEYVANGMVFNSKTRYTTNPEKANAIFDEELAKLKNNNPDMLEDKENYSITKSNRKGKRYFECYYKYAPAVSNFSVEMWTENLE